MFGKYPVCVEQNRSNGNAFYLRDFLVTFKSNCVNEFHFILLVICSKSCETSHSLPWIQTKNNCFFKFYSVWEISFNFITLFYFVHVSHPVDLFH